MESREQVLAKRIDSPPGWSPVTSELCFAKHYRGRGAESQQSGACMEHEGIRERMNMHYVGVIGRRVEHKEAKVAGGVLQGRHAENDNKHSGRE